MNMKLQPDEIAINLLEQLIAIPSFSREEDKTALVLQGFFKQYDIATERKGNNVWVRSKHFKPELPTILLNSHHDTVRPNSAYTRDPFEAAIIDGKLYGLGSNDAGGALVCLILAFLHFHEQKNLKFNLLLAAFNRQLTWENFVEVCRRSALTVAMLFGIFVGATAFAFVFKALGGETLIVNFIRDTGVGPWSILFVLMGMIFLLGFFFDWIEITLIVMPIFAPIVALLDFGGHVGAWDGVPNPIMIWFLILVAVNLQTSFLTPPFGFALFYMKGVAPPEVKIQQIYRGIIPFVALQILGLGLCIAFPAFVLWLPSVILGG
jgi:hypothetical protein